MHDATKELMIETVDVRVDYGDVTAVRDMNLSIERGEIFGLIGPNGAGKTSTLRVLATLLQPTYGEVRVGGYDAEEQPGEIHRLLGFMPDMPPVYDDLKCREMLDVFARAHFVDPRSRRQRVEQCLRDVELDGKRDVMAGTLSRGMKQRLILAKTMLHEPKILILDEPASGLDPIARIQLRRVMQRLAEGGVTILISSHILTELSDFCTSIGVMEKGVMVESGRIGDIVARMAAHRTIVIDLLDDPRKVEGLVAQHGTIIEVVETTRRIVLEFKGEEDELPEVLSALVKGGVKVKAFYERKMGVEDIMLRLGARQVS